MRPAISLMMAKSFGLRASNSSATRGRPPVMSRVLVPSRGMRASTSPAFTCGAVLDRQDGVDRHEVARLEPVRQHDDVALLVAQRDARLQIVAARLLLPVDDHAVRDAGGLVHHFAHRHAFDQVDVVHDAFALGDDRQGVRIPLRQLLALGHLDAVIGQQARAVRNAVTRPLAALVVDQDDLAVAAHDHRDALAVHDDVAVAHVDDAVDGRLDRALLGAALGRAADVERAHGELRARLADRLRRDHADRLADIDRRAARQVAAVALAAHAGLGLAGQHRTDLHHVDAGPLDLVDQRLVDDLRRP